MDNTEIKNNKTRPKSLTIVAILTFLTISRLMAITFLPTLQMYGGDSPDVWLGPWLTDSVLGLLLPVAIYLIYRGKGIKAWGFLIVYSALGAFDYATGIITEYIEPLPAETAASALVFGSLISTLLFQLFAFILLFRKDVIDHFNHPN